jgi:hypothetical protein
MKSNLLLSGKKRKRDEYPQLVEDKKITPTLRLKSKIYTQINVGEGIFLGYCRQHRNYYLDHQHTDGTIRCPICDKEWLTKHGFIKRRSRRRRKLVNRFV